MKVAESVNVRWEGFMVDEEDRRESRILIKL